MFEAPFIALTPKDNSRSVWEISRKASNAAELSESCELLIRLRPTDLDNFVSELREFGTAGRVTASLVPSA